MGFLFVLVLLVGIIFMILPFLETAPAPSSAPTVQARPRPQIFTSNPLTTLVNRIVKAIQSQWNRNRHDQQLAMAQQAKEQPRYSKAGYRADLMHSLPGDGTPAQEIDLPQDDTSDGNWLIGPQTSPEDMAAKGMHEVNITDEPAPSANPTDIPLPQEVLSAAGTNSLVENKGKNPSALMKAPNNPQISVPTVQTSSEKRVPLQKTTSAVALANLKDILYPEQRAEKLVRNAAEVKWGMLPDTEENRLAKADFIKTKTREVTKEIRRLQAEDLERILSEDPTIAEEERPDYLSEYLQACAEEGVEVEKHSVSFVVKDKDDLYVVQTTTTDLAEQIKNNPYQSSPDVKNKIEKFFAAGTTLAGNIILDGLPPETDEEKVEEEIEERTSSSGKEDSKEKGAGSSSAKGKGGDEKLTPSARGKGSSTKVKNGGKDGGSSSSGTDTPAGSEETGQAQGNGTPYIWKLTDSTQKSKTLLDLLTAHATPWAGVIAEKNGGRTFISSKKGTPSQVK